MMWTEILQLAMAPLLAAATALAPTPKAAPDAPGAQPVAIEYDMQK